MDIKGITVQRVLVAQAVDIATEIYLGVILDRTTKAITIMASAEGGVEIEEVAREAPEQIHRVHVKPARRVRRLPGSPIGLWYWHTAQPEQGLCAHCAHTRAGADRKRRRVG